MIIMKDVRKKYGDFEFQMSLEIPDGRITGLVGKNGAGKSTAIKLLLGLAKPDAGEIRILGSEGKELPVSVKQEIGASLAESGFCSQFTVDDAKHILARMYPAFDRDFFERQCRELKLPEKKKIKEFSTGMKAKLRVLTAITHNAKLLILDEPTAALDPIAEAQIYENFNEMVKNKTAIYISHRMSSCKFCDRIIVLDSGRFAEAGTHETLMRQEGIYYALYEAQAKHYAE